MRILGIDPGTVTMGYGIIETTETDDATLITYGIVAMQPKTPIAERLHYLYNRLLEIGAKYSPDVVAVEQPFIAKNARSALAIGRAQAVAILAGASRGLPVYEYTPAQIKQRVANYGTSTKEQVQEMVRLHLRLADIPEPADAADALAVALCHVQEAHLARLLAAGSPEGKK
jgi:crossover junction endodeoxyribonuclease RuvC